MEIRRIRTEESEAFLQLLCDVFGLDYTRAYGIFYNEPLFDLQRKWGLFLDDEPISILTTVPLRFGWGQAIGIAGVATNPRFQGQGYGQRLLEKVLEDATQNGEGTALLFAREQGLYARAGFVLLDEIVRGEIKDSVDDVTGPILEFDDVRGMYNRWSEADPNRLRRDDQRWRYWRWTLRMCAPIGDGYACLEGNIVRECVTNERPDKWEVGKGAEWFGTTTMARQLGLNLKKPEFDLYFMGYNTPAMPQMFMTDQF
jgi:GNAT superfamily N-acetyltransferase